MTNGSAPEQSNPAPSVQLRRDLYAFLPWLHLLRAVPIALRFRLLLLGGLGWGALMGGFLVASTLPFATSDKMSTRVLLEHRDEEGLLQLLRSDDFLIDQSIAGTLPLNSVLGSLLALFERTETALDEGMRWPRAAYEWTILLWSLLVWGIVGGAISRLAALQFARHERRGIVYALKFSMRQWLSYMIGPLLPLTGILCLAAVNALLGIVGSQGGILMILHIISVILGYLMLLLLSGVVIGWPLMVATISTEDSDGFDGLSRSFGFLWDRPWHALGLTALGTVLLVVGRIFIVCLASAANHMTMWSIVLLDQHELQRGMPKYFIHDISHIPVACFGPSFFFTAVTIIYFLLRQSDDGTPLTEVVSLRDKPLYPRAEVVETSAEVAATSDPAAPQATAAPSPAVPPKDA